MTELRFFDSELNPLLRTDRMISLNITKKYCGFGNVEIHFPITFGEIMSLAESHKCLICTTSDVTAVITGWRIAEDIALFGRTAEWLLTKRFVPPFSLTAAPERLAEYAVEQGAGDFVQVTKYASPSQETEYAYEGVTSVYDIVLKALEDKGLGFSLKAEPASRNFVFEIYKGRETNLLLSHSAGTADQICCTGDRQNMTMGSGWYLREIEDMGEWEPYTNNPKLSDESVENCFKYYLITHNATRFGISFTKGQYAYCDTRDGKLKSSETIPKPNWDYLEPSEGVGAGVWDAVLEGEAITLEAAREAFEKLDQKTEAEATVRHLEYRKDYELGDKVRIQSRWGSFSQTVPKTILGVEIFFDTDQKGTRPLME